MSLSKTFEWPLEYLKDVNSAADSVITDGYLAALSQINAVKDKWIKTDTFRDQPEFLNASILIHTRWLLTFDHTEQNQELLIKNYFDQLECPIFNSEELLFAAGVATGTIRSRVGQSANAQEIFINAVRPFKQKIDDRIGWDTLEKYLSKHNPAT